MWCISAVVGCFLLSALVIQDLLKLISSHERSKRAISSSYTRDNKKKVRVTVIATKTKSAYLVGRTISVVKVIAFRRK